MTQQRKTEFVTVNITRSARDALRAAALQLSAAAGRRLSMSDVISIALTDKRCREIAEIVQAEGGSRP